MRLFMSGALAPKITYGLGFPAVAKHGKVVSVDTPPDESLKRHRLAFGPDCVEIAAETRSATELRADGLSVKEIARVHGITERAVKARLAAAA
jgi:Sigma-70, region 4